MRVKLNPHAIHFGELSVDGLFQFARRHTNSFHQFLRIQSANRMFHDKQLRICLARLSLRFDEWQEGFSDYDVSLNATFFEFDTIMETPRRARTSIR